MNFLTPLFLLGGLALAAPIIYHLVRRTTRERTAFSSLMFLQPSPPRISKRQRFEHLLLLLLRCAALALLALGFARPFFTQAPVDDPTAAQPRRTVVLVDTSASMRRDGVWAAARARAEAVLRRAAPVDQVAVISFDQKATTLLSFEDWNRAAPAERVALAIGRLAALSPSWGGTQLGNALVTAAEALAEGEDGKNAAGPRGIVLVSDLQAGSRLDALQAYEWPKGVELTLEAVKARQPTNAGVQIVADGPDSTRTADAPVRVRVTNAADSTREQFKLGWARPAAVAGAAPDFIVPPLDAYVPPGQSRVFAVPVPKGVAGLEQISLSGDDEGFDNTAYVIPPAQQRTNVLWIGRDVAEDPAQPLFFLRRAFAETPRVTVQVTAVAPGGPLSPADVAAASVIFVSDALSPATAAALREQAQAGKTIVVVAKNPGIGPTLGALLGREPVSVEEGRTGNYAMFSEIDFQHPLFAAFADPRFSDFTKIRFWKFRKLDLSGVAGARMVAKFDHGDPAVAEVPVGRGRIYAIASGWQPDDSQLAVSSKFVPLMWSLLEQAGGVASFASQYFVGDEVVLPTDRAPMSIDVGNGAPVVVKSEDVMLTVKPPGGGVVTITKGEFLATTQPGIYEVTGGLRPRRFAVNLDANESRTAPLGPDELEQLGVPVAKAKVEAVVPAEKKSLLQGIEAESRQKLWRWFIVATLAVLLIESVLAGRTARRAALATEGANP
ncbi:MAG: BatA domain-containing protein [Opitutaceae bacterium]|nr:BatA domain-containing protein [Opitutaceae bacterium]